MTTAGKRSRCVIDLGFDQLELTGRPDGEAPEGHESLLEYYETRAQEAIESSAAFSLGPEDCSKLMREGLQYYHRYLSAFHLERYELVASDTLRNLRLFAFVGRHAARQRDKMEFDKYRPYVQMMNTRANASLALKEGDHQAALGLIDSGIKAIRKFLREYQQEEREHECPELKSLLNWRREVKRERPMEPLERLEQQLELSVVREDYEEAAAARPDPRAACPSAAVRHLLLPSEDMLWPTPLPSCERLPSWLECCCLANQALPLPCSTRGGPFGEPTLNPTGTEIGISEPSSLCVSGSHLNCGFSKAPQRHFGGGSFCRCLSSPREVDTGNRVFGRSSSRQTGGSDQLSLEAHNARTPANDRIIV